MDKTTNFLLRPGEAFSVPIGVMGYQPLGGEQNTLADNKVPKLRPRWQEWITCQSSDFNDWYETVKINYGISPGRT